DLVDHLAAAVVAAAGVALGVLVGEHRAGRLDDRRTGEVLRGDQLDPLVLTAALGVDQAGERRVARGQRAAVHAGLSLPSVSSSSLPTRRWWRPPSKGVARKTATISSASAGATIRAPSASTLASLCWRARRAVNRSLVATARTPRR